MSPQGLLCGDDFDGDFAAALAVFEGAVVGGGCVFEGDDGVDDWFQLACLDEFGDFDELLLIGLDDEECVFPAFVGGGFGFFAGGDGDDAAAGFDDAEGTLEGFAADAIEDDVDVAGRARRNAVRCSR